MRLPIAGLLLTFSLAQSAAQALTIQAVGDVMLGSDYPDAYFFPQGAAAYIQPVQTYWRAPDVVNLINLEGTLGGSDSESKGCKNASAGTCYIFRMPASTADLLKSSNIHVATNANNHANDFGAGGRATSLRELQRVGIHAVGQPAAAYADLPAQKLRAIGCSFHVGTLHCVNDREQIEGLIREGKSRGNLVVLTAHWGAEGMANAHVTRKDETYLGGYRGNPYQLAHGWIDLGADLVIGHGPHVPRAMELYKGRLIAYSLGNFATFGTFNVREWNGLAPLLRVELEADGKLKSGQIVSFRQTKQAPLQLDETSQAFKVIKQLTVADFNGGGLQFGEDNQSFAPQR